MLTHAAPACTAPQVTSTRNVFWNTSGHGLSPTFPSTHTPRCPGYACNLAALAPTASFAAWQLRGHERGSVVADPGFADPAADDYNLKHGAASPAARLGFVPLDLTKGVGPDW
eukprot:SAG22_NODE_719_length_7666_cov_5.819083_8_plen_113_part_00